MLSVLVLAIPLVAAGGEVRGVYLAFLALVVLGSFEAVQPLGTAFQFLGRSVGAGERLFEIVDAEPEVKDPANATPPTRWTTNSSSTGWASATRRTDRLALEDISFTLERGRRVAVVGPSGAGKSTLAGLDPALLGPDAGRDLASADATFAGTPRTTCGP